MTKPLAFMLDRKTSSKLQGVIRTTNPIIYYPMNEISGSTVYNYGNIGKNANGTYGTYRIGMKLADAPAPGGGLAPLFYGSGSATAYLTTPSLASFKATFDGQVGTVGIWIKISGSAWTDAISHQAVRIYDGAGQNVISISKTTTDNTLSWLYIANAVSKEVTSAAYANNNWNFLAMTYNLGLNEMKAFINGIQVGTTQTTLGTFTNNSTTQFRIADYFAGNSIWKGWLSHLAVWNSNLSISQMINIYNIGTI